MVKEIRIYIEGGGDGKNTKALIRQGFSKFLQELVELARSKKIKWAITAVRSLLFEGQEELMPYCVRFQRDCGSD